MSRLTTYDKMDAFESSPNTTTIMLSVIATVLFAMLIGLVFMG